MLSFSELKKDFPIFINNPDVLEKWQKRLHYIQVDETQDSSQKQFMLIEMLSQFHKNLFVCLRKTDSVDTCLLVTNRPTARRGHKDV